VVDRSRQVLAALERGDTGGDVPVRGLAAQSADGQLSLFAPRARPDRNGAEANLIDGVIEEIRSLDPDRITPIEALGRLAAMVERLSGQHPSGKN
jgi:hypothetical protein